MAKDPAFLFYPGDYLRDTQCLSTNAQVAYDRIMCEHMRTSDLDSENITVTKKMVDFFCKRLTEDERDDLHHVLLDKDDKYQIEWVAESIAKRRAFGASRSKNRSSKASSSKDSSQKTSLHMEDENENENENEKRIESEAREAISYLNEIAERQFGLIESNVKFARSRLKAGATLEDLKGVIVIQTMHWKADDKMKKFLRPETLFNSTKFETYFQEVLEARKNPTKYAEQQKRNNKKGKPTSAGVMQEVANRFASK